MLPFTIKVRPQIIPPLKQELATRYPDIAASHRIEAASRGLGFLKYASLKAVSNTGQLAQVDGMAFNKFLNDRGYDSALEPFYLSLAAIAVRDVMAADPDLTLEGMGASPMRLPHDRYNDRLKRERDALLDDSALIGFLRSLELIGRLQHSQKVNARAHSYRLKHIAEKFDFSFPNGEKENWSHVANGSLIAAAIHLGIRIKRHDDDGELDLNPSFYVTQDSVELARELTATLE